MFINVRAFSAECDSSLKESLSILGMLISLELIMLLKNTFSANIKTFQQIAKFFVINLK